MFRRFRHGGLREKITSAYIALVIAIVALGLIAFSDLLFLQIQVNKGEMVADLKDAILEMRREEKNLFLYVGEGALVDADRFAAQAQEILQQHRAELASVIDHNEQYLMNQRLSAYRDILGRWWLGLSGSQKTIREELRALGRQLYLSVESFSKRERQILSDATKKSKWFLIVSLALIGLSIYIIGRHLRRAVSTPLKRLETDLKSIAEGHFDSLRAPSKEREFVAFTDAFNRMLKELEIRQRRMLQSEKLASLGILASGVAHELNNPLSNISSSCQLLIEELTEADPKQLNSWLKQIDSETERGRHIVRTLLDFGSQQNFQQAPVHLSALIKQTRTILDNALKKSQIRLTTEIPEDLIVIADKQRLQQLFINLAQNAIHAGGRQTHLHVSASRCGDSAIEIPEHAVLLGDPATVAERAGAYSRIIFADDGPGIPKDLLSKVVDPFFTTREPGKGVGLGLFIVHEIVREHDGCLAIASVTDEGTQVIVLLPCKVNSDGE